MYLALRVTGTIIAPILLHASTDPSIFLQTAYPAEGALTGFAGLGNIVVVVAGFVTIFFIRGHVGETRPDFSETRPGLTARHASVPRCNRQRPHLLDSG